MRTRAPRYPPRTGGRIPRSSTPRRYSDGSTYETYRDVFMKRLNRLVGAPLHVAANGVVAAGSHSLEQGAEDPEGCVAGRLSEKLQVDSAGRLTAASVVALESARLEAAEQHDYRSAAALDDFLRVLGPSTVERPLEYYAPQGLEEQVQCFEEHGFVVLPQMVTGSKLEQLQQAWLRLEACAYEKWASSGAPEQVASDYKHSFNSQTFGVPFLSQEPALMLDLLDHPRALPLLARVCGEDIHAMVETEGLWRGTGGMRAAGGSVSSLVPDPPGTCGYITWHKDKPQPEGHWFPRSRVAKMFVYPFGVTAEQAPTTVVPGSHRLQGRGPKTTLTPGFVGQGQVEGLPHTAMPHALPVTVGPGSALIFDNAIWHTAYPHTGSEPRRYFILGYQSSRARVGDPHAHRPWGLATGQAEQWAERGLLNPVRETLLGMRDGVYICATSSTRRKNTDNHSAAAGTKTALVSKQFDNDVIPFQLPLDGSMPPELLRAQLEEAQRVTSVVGQFRAAAMLGDLTYVLCPRPPLTAKREYAPATVDAQLDCFRQNGFVCLSDVFVGVHLQRMQAAWRRALKRADTSNTDGEYAIALEELLAEAVLPHIPAVDTVQTTCHQHGGDAVMLDALDAPPVLSLLEAIIGPGRFTSDDVALAGVQAFVAAKNTCSDADVQGVWGRFDVAGPADDWPHPSHRVVQVAMNLDDHDATLEVVPGSHRLALNCEDVYQTLTDIPNQVKVASRPGSVCVYDAAIWRKKAQREQSSFTLGYHSQRANMPTGQKPNDALIDQLEATGSLRDSLRRLFGCPVE